MHTPGGGRTRGAWRKWLNVCFRRRERNVIVINTLKFSACQFTSVFCLMGILKTLKTVSICIYVKYQLSIESNLIQEIALLRATVSEILGRFDCKTRYGETLHRPYLLTRHGSPPRSERRLAAVNSEHTAPWQPIEPLIFAT